ncbi:MAG: twin-arginine translocase subunit TatC [Planctomycetaceae bacterium]
MPRNRDLFDDSTMSFGEHLEVLRVHVWRALVGLVIGVCIALFYGDQVIGVLRTPIDDALRRANLPASENDLGGVDFGQFLKNFWTGEEPPPEPEPEVEPGQLAEDELQVEISLKSLKHIIEKAAPGTLREPPQESESGSQSAATETSEEQTAEARDVVVPLVLKAPEFAIFRITADRANHAVTYKVEEAFMTYMKVSVVAGFVLASPWIFYQIWQFVAAGLYQHERRYIYIYLPMSIGLFAVGAVFCFIFVFPIVLDFLISFNKWLHVELQPRLSEYINLVLMLPVMFGISFQLPMIMLFIERIGVVTVKGYIENWRIAVLVIAVASMLLTPSDPSSMLLMMFPLIFLYFGGILLCQFRPGAAADPLA